MSDDLFTQDSIEIIGVFFNIVLVIIIFLQFSENIRANNTAEKSLKHIRKNAKKEQKLAQLEISPFFKQGDNGAVFKIVEEKEIGSFGVYVNFENVGKTPALDVKFEGVVLFGKDIEAEQIQERDVQRVVMPGESLSTIVTLPPMSLNEIEKGISSGKTLHNKTTITYSNVFGDRFEYKRCAFVSNVRSLIQNKKGYLTVSNALPPSWNIVTDPESSEKDCMHSPLSEWH